MIRCCVFEVDIGFGTHLGSRDDEEAVIPAFSRSGIHLRLGSSGSSASDLKSAFNLGHFRKSICLQDLADYQAFWGSPFQPTSCLVIVP